MSIRSLLEYVGVKVGPVIKVGDRVVDDQSSTPAAKPGEGSPDDVRPLPRSLGMGDGPETLSTDNIFERPGTPPTGPAGASPQIVRRCRYCPDPMCPEDCPECGGAIHDLDAVPPVDDCGDPSYVHYAHTANVPLDAFRDLVDVAQWVTTLRGKYGPEISIGDAKARRALSALEAAGLLDQFGGGETP